MTNSKWKLFHCACDFKTDDLDEMAAHQKSCDEFRSGIAETKYDHRDKINHPSHYNQGKIEVIDFVKDQKLNFDLGNAVKYICRCDHKGKKEEDLRKAIVYIKHELESMKETPRSMNEVLAEDPS